MDFNLKKWRFQDNDESPAKLQKLFFDTSQNIKQEEEENSSNINSNSNSNSNRTEYFVSPQLHLFVPTDGDDNSDINSNEQHQIQVSDKITTSQLPKMGGGGSYFSYGQWQELELQALIYRHMLAGAAIPPQLLQMVHKSLFNGVSLPASSSFTSPYLVHPLHHYSQYHSALMQSGYWGRGAMDPEPGRCRRTDGKKWRCSREVVGGQKYCERHVHRGRNRSRKPVELHPATTTTTLIDGTTSNAASSQAAEAGRIHYDLSGTSSSIDGFHHFERHTGSRAENKFTSETENMNGELKYGGQPLRHFFDDWTNRSSDSSASSTSLSISTPGNVTSDFSLKLATGNGNESVERETTQSGWGGARWTQANRVLPIGGPLAEALRGSEVSPTSVLNLVK